MRALGANGKWCALVLVFHFLTFPRSRAEPASRSENEGFSSTIPVAAASLESAIASKKDLWAEAALRQTNGPSLEFFRGLIGPLHYVNTDFQHYPIVLSAPRALTKGRLTSNGSAINARANTRAWNEPGTPVLFRAGPDELGFGEYLQRLTGPKLAEGYLPIIQLEYDHGGGHYVGETFASVDAPYASNGVALTRFTFQARPGERGDKGRIVVRVDSSEPMRAGQDRLLNRDGRVLLWFDEALRWDATRGLLEANLTNGMRAAVAVATVPASATAASPLAGDGYEAQRKECRRVWQGILNEGMNLETPEDYVNNAWRALLIANFSLIHGDRIHYSAGNQYDKLYEQEGSQAALALQVFGHEAEVRRLLVPLLDFTRKGLEYHQAGHKLEDVCRYYWQTRDAEYVRSIRPHWQKEVERLLDHRSAENGLYPREQYCGDIATPVFSLTSNAEGWRALRDVSAVLGALGEPAESRRLASAASGFHKDILAAVHKSLTPGLDPEFVPNALLGEEHPYEVITATKLGSYWNLMANNILGSEIFGQNSRLETDMIRYFQMHGGLFMGLLRARPWPSFWIGESTLNPLYGWAYVRTLLRRDEPDRALVSFYGMLAAGLTPETFTCGEGCDIRPLDEWGRQFYCPPNSAGNAFFLLMLRNLLVQDWDLDEDGRPDTLRLLFATPRRWLADGQTILVERAPTAFGPVFLRVESKLSQRTVVAELALPERNPPPKALLRLRLPDGWRMTSAQSRNQNVAFDSQGTCDISGLHGRVMIVFDVAPGSAR